MIGQNTLLNISFLDDFLTKVRQWRPMTWWQFSPRSVRPLSREGRVRRGLHRAHWRQDHARCAGQRAGAQQEVGSCDGEVNCWPCDLRMTHRGACSADNDSGDGAGALLGIPHSFYVETLKYVHYFHFIHSILKMFLCQGGEQHRATQQG